jgi:multisubunit Na+/H+ antiporter MnhB subunit
MIRTLLYIGLAIIFFSLLYDIYKTRSYKKPKQIISAIAGALILVYILYTCKSDN